MKTIEQLLNSIKEQSKKADPVKFKQPIKRGKPVKEKAVFKLVIYFKTYKKSYPADDGKRNFYSYAESYNAEQQKIIKCEKTSINKVLKLLKYTFAEKYKTALIYHSNPPGFHPGCEIKQVYKFTYDRLISETPYTFTLLNNQLKFIFLNNE
jgi:hypothetical protein